ncbi:MAG: cysteine--tRNA ligase [Thermoprotei archaeon]|nr:MAG: cysteine--tRNA ligase [Thermoprotei archaeon]RLF23088.1 MAG: cysteine--tRNA ligase [Thermoprotei archaeon]
MVVFVLYNTLTKRKELFEPINPPFVKIYLCGVTPYDRTHIGHLRAYLAVDVLRRYLRYLGYRDIAVSNFTDIDDKLIRRQQETGRSYKEIAEENIRDLFEVLRKVNVLPYVIYPKVTMHIEDIIEFIKGLIEKGHAYVSHGSVYFDVDTFPDYGKLSGIKSKEKWRQEEDVIKEKKNPYDFALWKRRKPGEPYWDSPWGPGRPGWHIECSVMSSKYLGEQFDIHAAGRDLIFPHHENEIAQAEAYFGKKPWVKYWFHVGLVRIRGEKMSKSLGNIIPASDFLEEHDAMVTRYFLIKTHYRDPLDYTDEGFAQAEKEYESMTSTIKTLKSMLPSLEPAYRLSSEEEQVLRRLWSLEEAFFNHMNDDLDITLANARLLEFTRLVNRHVIPSENYSLALEALTFYQEVNRIYGTWDEVFYAKAKEEELVYKLIELIIDIRKELRRRRDYELADEIRSKLRELGIILMDKGLETMWRME